MKNWNVIVTVIPGPGRESRLLREFRRLGHFEPSQFKDVCLGQVEDAAAFLETLHAARANGEAWLADLGRAIPVEKTFAFTPDALAALLAQETAPFAERMRAGSFHVRLERRGLVGRVKSQEVERQLGAHLVALAGAAGKALHVSFAAPDYVVAAETVGSQCGIALLDRPLMERYPFVLPH